MPRTTTRLVCARMANGARSSCAHLALRRRGVLLPEDEVRLDDVLHGGVLPGVAVQLVRRELALVLDVDHQQLALRLRRRPRLLERALEHQLVRRAEHVPQPARLGRARAQVAERVGHAALLRLPRVVLLDGRDSARVEQLVLNMLVRRADLRRVDRHLRLRRGDGRLRRRVDVVAHATAGAGATRARAPACRRHRLRSAEATAAAILRREVQLHRVLQLPVRRLEGAPRGALRARRVRGERRWGAERGAGARLTRAHFIRG